MKVKKIKGKIKKALKEVPVLLLLCFLMQGIIFVPVLRANWLDSWFDHVMATSAPPDYFEGQKRNYLTFGGFSYRLPTRTDYLFSIEKPSIRVGCGGIDLFMGGFSFLNPDYLVEKIQRMIQAAPFIAFDVALNTLSPQLSEITKKAESIIDWLNSIQLSECQINIPRPTFLTKKTSSEEGGMQARGAAGESVKEGLSSFWHEFWKKYVNITDSSISLDNVPSLSDRLKGLDTAIKNWIEYGSGQEGLIWYLASNGYFNDDVAAIFRAYVGDIYYSASTTDKGKSIIKFDYSGGICSNATIDRAFDGGWIYYARGSTCTQENATQFFGRIERIVLDAYDKVINKEPPDPDFASLVEHSPIPVYSFLKLSVALKDRSILYNVAPGVAKLMVYYALLDLSGEMNGIIKRLREYARNREGGESGDITKDALKSLSEAMEKLRENMWRFEQVVMRHYRIVIAEINTSFSMAYRIARFHIIVEKEMSESEGGK